MSDREFPTPVVMSAVSGFLLCDFSDVQEFCEFMAGEPVWTHQLPRVGREAQASFLRQHPDKQWAIDLCKTVNKDNYKAVADRLIDEIGPLLAMHPMSEDEHECIDPVSELAEKVHPDKIVVVPTAGAPHG